MKMKSLILFGLFAISFLGFVDGKKEIDHQRYESEQSGPFVSNGNNAHHNGMNNDQKPKHEITNRIESPPLRKRPTVIPDHDEIITPLAMRSKGYRNAKLAARSATPLYNRAIEHNVKKFDNHDQIPLESEGLIRVAPISNKARKASRQKANKKPIFADIVHKGNKTYKKKLQQNKMLNKKKQRGVPRMQKKEMQMHKTNPKKKRDNAEAFAKFRANLKTKLARKNMAAKLRDQKIDENKINVSQRNGEKMAATAQYVKKYMAKKHYWKKQMNDKMKRQAKKMNVLRREKQMKTKMLKRTKKN